MQKIRRFKTQQLIRYRNLVRRGLAVLLLCVMALGVSGTHDAATAVPYQQSTSPRLLNYYLRWFLDESEVQELAKWDMVILDIENQVNNPQRLRQLRALNPDIIILGYLTSQELERNVPQVAHLAPLRKKRWDAVAQTWWLSDDAGNRLFRWPGTWMINSASNAPAANGMRWIDFLSGFAVDEVMASGLWDGVFFDNTWDSITPFVGERVDLDRDGRTDVSGDANVQWRSGVAELVNLTRQKHQAAFGKDLLIFGNGDRVFTELNGMLLENFPDNGWSRLMNAYEQSSSGVAEPSFGLINANTRNTGARNDYRHFRFTYGSSLLSDGYYSFDFGDRGHEQTWWYDEYGVSLGKPLRSAVPLTQQTSPGFGPGVWRRDFEDGAVFVNSTNVTQEFSLGGEFETLRGTQDTRANHGLIVERLRLAPSDARVVLRPVSELRDTAFLNGDFVRVLDRTGSFSRNGFFSFVDQFEGGQQLLISNINNLGVDEVIRAVGPELRIYSRGFWRVRSSWYPLGQSYGGQFDIAVGNVIGDEEREVVLTTTQGVPRVLVYDLRGKLLVGPLAPFGEGASGGAYVAVGNTDNAGYEEIIVSERTGSRVRVLRGNGEYVDGHFQPFGSAYTGGVVVAVGDIDGNGRTDIIAAPRSAKQADAYVFDGRLAVFTGLLPLPQLNRQERAIAAYDFEGDGTSELVVFER